MDDQYYDPNDLPHVPRIEINSIETIEDIELELQSNHDEFYRRIITYIIDALENRLEEDEPLAILIDGEGIEYHMELPEDGYLKSLGKCMEYFTSIEEYETCSLVKDLITIIEKNELR
jgi:hypothetical protein